MQGSILVYSDLQKSRTIQIFLDFSSFSALCKVNKNFEKITHYSKFALPNKIRIKQGLTVSILK